LQTVEFIDALKTGVPKIDDQHEALVDMINFLIEAKDNATPPETISFVLGEMTKYVYLHFRDEEQYMLDHFYPGLAVHRLIHETFEDQVLAYQKQYDEGRTDLLDDVLEFLTNWLIQHIQGDDKDMVQEILANREELDSF
jgi:hemerythrin